MMETGCGTSSPGRTSLVFTACSFTAIAGAELCIIVVGFLWGPSAFGPVTSVGLVALLLFFLGAVLAGLGVGRAGRLYEKFWGFAAAAAALAGIGFSLWILHRIDVVSAHLVDLSVYKL